MAYQMAYQMAYLRALICSVLFCCTEYVPEYVGFEQARINMQGEQNAAVPMPSAYYTKVSQPVRLGIENNPDSIEHRISSAPQHGSIEHIDSAWYYRPEINFIGQDSFVIYSVSNGVVGPDILLTVFVGGSNAESSKYKSTDARKNAQVETPEVEPVFNRAATLVDSEVPVAVLQSPVSREVVTDFPFRFSGVATDDVSGIASVEVVVRNRDTVTHLQADGSMGNFVILQAQLDKPGEQSTRWSLDVPSLPPGQYYINVRATDNDSSVSNWKATYFSVVSNPYSMGTGISADSLWNTRIGGSNNMQSAYSFVAQSSGTLSSLRWFMIFSFTRPNSHEGDGGVIRVSIRENAALGDVPADTELASALITRPLVNGESTHHPLVSFANPPNLIAGRKYHVVFENTASDAANNWVSINSLASNASSTSDLFRVSGSADWSQLIKSDGRDWAPRESRAPGKLFTPVMQLNYSNGQVQGHTYMEVGVTPVVGSNGETFGGPKFSDAAKPVGQTFTTPTKSVTIQSISARIKRETASGIGRLNYAVVDVNSGQRTRFYLSSSSAKESMDWVTMKAGNPITLKASTQYRLEIYGSHGAVFSTFPIRQGTSTNDPDNEFDVSLETKGRAEFSDGNIWQGWDQWQQSDRHDFDLQFYIILK